MSDFIEVSQDILPDLTLIRALRSEHRSVQSLELLAHLRRRVMENRTALQRHSEGLNRAYEESARGSLDANGLVRLAEAVLEAERGAAEQLYPWMEALGEARALKSKHSQEAQQYLDELHDVAAGWLAAYQTLRERLIKLASERHGGPSTVLRARPVEGDIDHEALNREFMARFPKIRAALAK